MTDTSQSASTSAARTFRTQKVLALSVGGVLSTLSGLAFSMIAVRYVSKHDYATIRQTFLVYDLVSPLLLLGLPNALYYFLPRSPTDSRGVLIDNTVSLAALSVLFAVFLVAGGRTLLAARFDNPDLQSTLVWLAIYGVVLVPLAGMSAALVIAERVRQLAVFNVCNSVAVAIAGICAVLLTRSYEAPILARVAVAALALPIGLWMMFGAFQGPIRLPRADSIAQMTRYAVPLGLATMLGTITMQLHGIVVASMCKPEEFALYINGAIELPIVGIVTGSIAVVTFAEMSSACAAGNKAAALDVFRGASVKSACLLFPAMFYFAAAAEPFIVLLYSDAYRASTVPFMICLLLLPARIVVYGSAMMAMGMSREILFRSALDLVINAVLCVVLVHRFGYAGAAFGLVVTLYLWSIPYNLAKMSERYETPWHALLPWKRLGTLLFISGATALAPLAIVHATREQWVGLQLLASAPVYALAYGYVLYHFGFVSPPQAVLQRIPECLRRPDDA